MRDTPALRKARGAFFTPTEVSEFLSRWAVRSAQDRVLEPSCGHASFLIPAAARLRELGAANEDVSAQLMGVEVHEPSARAAMSALLEHGAAASVLAADFFDVEPAEPFDAVVGNPPYVRYQQFAGEARAKALRAALAHGVRLNGLASSWAAFTVHASRFLKPDGRLALVLPAELLSVSYAAGVRRFLLQRFGSVRLVMFEELVFDGVLEDVVLLLAEGTGPAACFEVHQTRDQHSLAELAPTRWVGVSPRAGEKWTAALLPAEALDAYRAVTSSESFGTLIDWGETSLGAVTGSNEYFTISPDEARRLRFAETELLPVSPPGSRHLRRLAFTSAEWSDLGAAGQRTLLVFPNVRRPSTAARAYIASGAARDVHLAYKCRTRDPWWRVPVLPAPDLLLTYMDHERPRLVANEAGVRHLNSLYGVELHRGLRRAGRELLPIASLNCATLLGAEIVGRAYGGGMLKLEPTEADRLPVPGVDLLERTAPALRAIRPAVERALGEGDLPRASRLVDQVILERGMGMDTRVVATIRRAKQVLLARRVARGRSGRVAN